MIHVRLYKHLPHLLLDCPEARAQDKRANLRDPAIQASDHKTVQKLLGLDPLLHQDLDLSADNWSHHRL